MKSTVEPLEGNKVKVSVEVEEAEFDREVDAAFRRIAREVRIPGFRPGKVPRRVLEARIGSDAARADALQHALPEYYVQAVSEHDVDAIAQPDIDITAGEDGGAVSFDAVVEIRPRVSVGGYGTLRVTIDQPTVSDEDVESRLRVLREQFADLETVDRPAQDGDHVTIDIAGSQDGEPLGGLTAEGYLYEVGSEAVLPELDVQLRGAKPGDILAFSAAHPQEGQSPVDVRVLVKEVKAKVLPEADDDFAGEASEFDTIDELRADLRRRLSTVKRVQAAMQIQQRTAEALADLVEEDVPEPLVSSEVRDRLQDMAMRFEAQGMDLGAYLEATGQDSAEFLDGLRDAAVQSVKVDLALRAVAEAEGIDVDDDEMEGEYAAIAERVKQKPAQVRRQVERAGQVALVRSDVQKRKALEWLVEHVEVVDPDGKPVDRAALELDDDTATPAGDPIAEGSDEAPASPADDQASAGDDAATAEEDGE
ncbi:MAG: trigger factor [Actinobacteria bacterium]|nr:trigger factor [Actinomycetota bacterium]